LGIVKSELACKPTYLIFDDSQLSKPHARDIEGLDISFDGSTGRPELGYFKFVLADAHYATKQYIFAL
jgi:hypothetical protein